MLPATGPLCAQGFTDSAPPEEAVTFSACQASVSNAAFFGHYQTAAKNAAAGVNASTHWQGIRVRLAAFLWPSRSHCLQIPLLLRSPQQTRHKCLCFFHISRQFSCQRRSDPWLPRDEDTCSQLSRFLHSACLRKRFFWDAAGAWHCMPRQQALAH